MKLIARNKNVEYSITERDIPRYVAMGCTIYEVASNGFRVHTAPSSEEDFKNKVAEQEGIIADLRNQIAIDNARINSLVNDNAKLRKENEQLVAAQAAAEATNRKSRKKAEE